MSIYCIIWGLLCEKQERLKEAMQMFNDVIEIDAGVCPLHIMLGGMVFDKQENYQASYLEFSRGHRVGSG
jgi:hypothetical protein